MSDDENERPARTAATSDVRLVSGVKPPHPFTIGSNLLENWKIFWKTYAVLSQLSTQPNEVQVALLLHTLADDALKVYNGFHFTTDESSSTVIEILDKFHEFAVGEVNETYERFMFNKRCQEEGELFDKFLSDLRTLVKSCSYCDKCVKSMIRDRIVLGIRESDVQTELLKVRNLTLEKCIDICKAAENATLKNKMLRPENSVVNRVSSQRKGSSKSKLSNFDKPSSDISHSEVKDCKFCSKKHIKKKEKCPAYGKQCSKCKQLNHFACKCPNSKVKKSVNSGTVSKSNKVCQIYDESSSDGEWINSTTTSVVSKYVKCLMLVDVIKLTFRIDTGATVNTLPVKYAKNIQKTDKVLSAWNNTKQVPLSICRRNVVNPRNNKKYSVEFIVFEDNFTPLLGLKASKQMGLVNICENNFESV